MMMTDCKQSLLELEALLIEPKSEAVPDVDETLSCFDLQVLRALKRNSKPYQPNTLESLRMKRKNSMPKDEEKSFRTDFVSGPGS